MTRPPRSLALAAILALGAPLVAHAAGDVLAVVQRGSLKILGDDVGNAIHVVPGVDPGSWDVESLDGTTTVNGSLSAFHAVGVERNLKIEMQDGDDEVVIEDTALIQDIDIAMGVGGDRVAIDDSQILGNTRIGTGIGDDVVSLGTSTFDGSVIVQTDSGADAVSLDLVETHDRVRIATGVENDVVAIGGGSAFTDVVVVVTNEGDDTVTIDDALFSAVLDVSLGQDDDAMALANTTALRRVELNGGSEVDVVDDAGGNAFAQGLTLIKVEAVL